MKIIICGSMTFSREMEEIKEILEEKGHEVTLPLNTDKYIKGTNIQNKVEKKELDVIKKDYEDMKEQDAIFVLNYDKNNIKNYIGGNSLIEISFAYVLNKKIFLLNPVPEMSYSDEIEAMNPIVIYGDLSRI